MPFDFDNLSTKLGYRFKNPELARRALTHRSAGKINNERFEFLGDAILGMVIAAELFQQYPDATEGELSRMRANLVNRDALLWVAKELDLGQYIQLGAGERKSGGTRRTSILADAVEAIIAAVYLDSNLIQSTELIRRLFDQKLHAKEFSDRQKDSKTRLQELLQSKGHTLPVYTVKEISGEAHDQNFTVDCAVVLLDQLQTGQGKSKQLAEQDAAEKVLDRLEKQL